MVGVTVMEFASVEMRFRQGSYALGDPGGGASHADVIRLAKLRRREFLLLVASHGVQ